MGSAAEEVSSRLLSHFGSLGAVVEAGREDLRACSLYGESWVDTFVAMRELIMVGIAENAVRSPIDTKDEKLRLWIRSLFVGLREERLLAVFVDADSNFITHEWMARGNLGSVEVCARRVFSRGLALDAHAILLAHNHPSGNAEPSEADRLNSARFRELASQLGITLLDHQIVARGRLKSMADWGML